MHGYEENFLASYLLPKAKQHSYEQHIVTHADHTNSYWALVVVMPTEIPQIAT